MTNTHHAEVCQSGKLRNWTTQVTGERCGREADHQRDLGVVLGLLRGHHEELSAPLRVADIEERLLARRLQNVIDGRRKIVHSEFVKTAKSHEA